MSKKTQGHLFGGVPSYRPPCPQILVYAPCPHTLVPPLDGYAVAGRDATAWRPSCPSVFPTANRYHLLRVRVCGPRLRPLSPCHHAHVSPRRLRLRRYGRLSPAVRSPTNARTSIDFLFSLSGPRVLRPSLTPLVPVSPCSRVPSKAPPSQVEDNPPYPRQPSRLQRAQQTPASGRRHKKPATFAAGRFGPGFPDPEVKPIRP